jgi:hypothetical protein
MDHHTTNRESTTIDIALLDTLIGDSTPSRPTLPTETTPLPTYTLTPPEELAVLTVRLANLTKRIVKVRYVREECSKTSVAANEAYHAVRSAARGVEHGSDLAHHYTAHAKATLVYAVSIQTSCMR